MAASAGSRAVNVMLAAQGMPWRTMKSLAKALLPSRRAVAASWPKTAIPSRRTASARPATSGTSGPTTTRSGRFRAHQEAMPATSSTPKGRQVPSAASASLPGAAKSSTGPGPALSFMAMACSRPPEPMRRIFMLHPFQESYFEWAILGA